MEQRIWGYELAEIEKELIFEKENTGYVRWEDRKHGIACLDPSPFLKTTKFEYYVFQCEYPKEGMLIEAEIDQVREILDKDKEGVMRRFQVKFVTGWRELNPFEIIRHKKPLISRDELRYALLSPFTRKDNAIADSIAVYLASSPPFANRKGGIIAGCLIRNKRIWRTFTKILSVIPPQFRSIRSRYYYDFKYGEPTNLNVEKMAPAEINLDYVNPENIHIHVPQPLVDVDVKPVREFEPWLKEVRPLVRALILQMVLLNPKIDKMAERALLDEIYEIHDNLLANGTAPFKPDLTSIQRIVTSLSRLEMCQEVTPRKVTEAAEFWLKAYEESLKITSRIIDLRGFFKLDEKSRKLYMIIRDIGSEVSEAEIYREATKRKMNEFDVELALEELRIKGFIIQLPSGKYAIVERG
ncbi:hypothetical protein DRP04_05630 [Archaeoglobales archaeon]|nr:MAG: hypothetical protein DRP04_05630 [Archaeoglobales archaeon]